MFKYQGRTALVTGASWGIGTSFVQMLATRGMNVILAARSEDRIRELANDVSAKHHVRAEAITVDLSQGQAAETVREEVERRGLAVDLLVNNAGFGTRGHFENLPAKRDHDEIMLNVAAVVGLSHAFLPGMLNRDGGAIINVASTAAFQPIPFMSVYAATKAFLVSFSLALAEEYRGRNVHILALCPGPTDTQFFKVAAATDISFGRMRTADQVVTTGLRALEKRRKLAVDGTINGLMGSLSRILPSTFTARMAGRVARPRQGKNT